MALFEKLRGIMGDLFQINGPDGPQIKDTSGVIEAKNFDDSAFTQVRVADSPGGTGAALKDAINVLLGRSRLALIQFSFNGSGPPAPGANTNKFGICHTTNGGYTQGQIYYDSGTALVLIPNDVAAHITTTAAITGAQSFIANGLYAREGAGWVLKGDVVGAATGLVRTIEVPYSYTDDGTPVLSTTVIEAGARVLRAWNKVETAFNAGTPTVLVDIDGSVTDEVLMATTDSKPKKANTYLVPEIVLIIADSEGPVRVTVDKSGSTSGDGRVIVEYVTPFA
jgi:hypothetical protein